MNLSFQVKESGTCSISFNRLDDNFEPIEE